MTSSPDQIVHGGLSLERYASTRAELRHAGSTRRQEVLARNEISEADWDAADRAWSEAIERDFDRADGLLVEFAGHFVQARQRVQAAPPLEVQACDAEPPPSVEVPSFLAVPTPQAASPRKPFLVGTIDIDVRTIPVLAVPFVPAKGPVMTGPPAAATPASQEGPVQPSSTDSAPRSERGPAGISGTANLDVHRIVAAILPFPQERDPAPRSSQDRAPTLTLEQYASLTAELAESRASAAEVRARYRVPSEDGLRELNASWGERFAADPALRQRWGELVAQYRAWLARQG